MSLENIFNKLGFTPSNGLCITTEDNWKGQLPVRLELLLKNKLKPDAFFVLDSKPIILFYDSPRDKKKRFKDIWNFNESPIIIISEPNSVEIYNGFSYLKEDKSLEKLAVEKDLNDFSYFELVTGKSLKNYRTKIKQQSRVDSYLLKNISYARKLIVDKYEVEPSLANALIGKCIFTRYLIDRKVKLNFEDEMRIWKKADFNKLLTSKTRTIKFFNYLKTKFNGEAFLIIDYRLQEIPVDVFSVLKDLFEGVDILENQPSLFDVYDFSIIPVEFISNVYEYFIGKEKQAKQGAYYTPKFLVDYILSETVEKYFEKNDKQYNCKILDSACGSGIFLVESLRRIIERYIKLSTVSTGTKKFRDTLKQIAEDNIFGIDEDENAINVSVFSIYLTLLDYQKPKDIEKFKFPNLIENGNFHSKDFFDLNAKFNSQFGAMNFDFILGNPPWGIPKSILFRKYIEQRKLKENSKEKNKPEVQISNKEIAQAFLLRTSDFSTEETACALIVTSKLLYNLQAKKFREYFLHNYFIDKVFELASVRKEVFDKSNDKAIAPAAILFFRYAHGKNTDSNELLHLALKPNQLFTMFKIFILQRTDIKKVIQKKLVEYDWLWKVLVYGSYLDFNLIKRLKNDYPSIESLTSNKNKYLVGTGIQFSNNELYDASQLNGKPFIDTNGIEPFFINQNMVTLFNRETVHRIRNLQLFVAPILLIRKGIDAKDLKAKVAVSYNNYIFKDSLTCIKPLKKDGIRKLLNIEGLMSSDLYTYFMCNVFSSIGIEREQAHNKNEKFNFPYVDNNVITDKVKQIEKISTLLFEEEQKISQKIEALQTEKQNLVSQLNLIIFNSFELKEEEYALIDYTINITVPTIVKRRGYEKELFSSIPFNDKLLEEYIIVFLSRFKKSFNKKHLEAEIWYNNDIVGMFFKVVSDNLVDKHTIVWKEKKNEKLLKRIASLGVEKITDNLFVQKDIRGFEKDGFYIIKPNEKKLWHKAIAYLDVDEFADAILKAGREAQIG